MKIWLEDIKMNVNSGAKISPMKLSGIKRHPTGIDKHQSIKKHDGIKKHLAGLSSYTGHGKGC